MPHAQRLNGAASLARRLTLAMIFGLAAVASAFVATAPARAQVSYSPPATASADPYFAWGAPYVVSLVVPAGNPPVWIDVTGAFPTDGNAPGDLWMPGNSNGDTSSSGVLDGGQGTLRGSAGGTMTGCSTTGCLYAPPYAGWWGSETFTLTLIGTVCDDPSSSSGDNFCGGGSGITSGMYVTINVLPPPPVDQDGSINTGYGQAATVTLPISGVVTSDWIVSGPSQGTVSISGQQVTYTPSAGFYGSDAFTYDSSGPGGDSTVQTISVNVARPPPPATANGVINTPYATAASATLPASGIIDGYAIVTPPSHGTVGVSGSTATYTPSAGFYGPDSFVFDASGPGGTSNASTVSVNVGLPPAPAAQNNALTVPYNTAGSIGLTATGVISGYALASQPLHGSASLSGSTATYTPAANYIGPDSFTFTVTGPGGTSLGTITVTVRPPPPPVANSTSAICPYQTVCTVTLTTSGVTTTLTMHDPATNGSCALSGNVLTYTPAWGAMGADSCTFTAAGPGGTSNVATVYVTNQAPPLPDPTGSVGPVETAAGGIASAICAAGQSASFPVLPGPPVGTGYDPNWCSEQALTIAQQALQIQNQLSAITNLQSQVTAAQRQLQSLGTDSTSATLQTVNTSLVGVLQQAAGIGFNTQGAGVSFAAAYPTTSTTAGFNASQLATALGTWQANTAAALKNSVTVQNMIAQQQAGVQAAVLGAVAASNAAPGSTAATQATNQILAAVTTQLTQLQDILIASSQAYDVAQASAQQAGASAASVTTQTQGQTTSSVAAPLGVSDTSSL